MYTYVVINTCHFVDRTSKERKKKVGLNSQLVCNVGAMLW